MHTILHRTDLIVFPLHPPDNQHCSDDVYLREGGRRLEDKVWKVGNMATKIMGLVMYNVAWAEAYSTQLNEL